MPAFAYVTHDNKVSVLDTSNNTFISTISILPTTNLTKFLAVTPDGSFTYVTTLSNVAVIDNCTNAVATSITVGDFPTGIAITPNGKYVYVTNAGLVTSSSGSVSVIETATNTVIRTIPVGRSPMDIAITPNGRFAYVTNSQSDQISVIDTTNNTVIHTIPVGDFPRGIAITPNGNYAYVANQGQSTLSNTVSVIDTNTNLVVSTIIVGPGPTQIAITPDGKFAYVTNAGNNTISVISISTNTVTYSIAVDAYPFDIAITPDGKFAYITIPYSNNISIIDTTLNTVVTKLYISDTPLGISIANVNFPCPAPIKSMCIEATRIFDSCSFKEEFKRDFDIPYSIPPEYIQCDVIATECSVLSLTKVANQPDLVDVKLQIKVFIDLINECFYNYSLKKEVCFDKTIRLVLPEVAHVHCHVTSATCSCMQSPNISIDSCDYNLSCTLKVATTVKSIQLVQIEVPVLKTCETNSCSSPK